MLFHVNLNITTTEGLSGVELGSLNSGSSKRLRLTVCLILEESLLTIETALGHGRIEIVQLLLIMLRSKKN
jgi:hypothetical protein